LPFSLAFEAVAGVKRAVHGGGRRLLQSERRRSVARPETLNANRTAGILADAIERNLQPLDLCGFGRFQIERAPQLGVGSDGVRRCEDDDHHDGACNHRLRLLRRVYTQRTQRRSSASSAFHLALIAVAPLRRSDAFALLPYDRERLFERILVDLVLALHAR